jgi:hypothetical protein
MFQSYFSNTSTRPALPKITFLRASPQQSDGNLRNYRQFIHQNNVLISPCLRPLFNAIQIKSTAK